MIYLVIVGLVIAGFLFFWGLVELIRGERIEREREALREAARLAHEAARLAHDAQAHELNRSMHWEG